MSAHRTGALDTNVPGKPQPGNYDDSFEIQDSMSESDSESDLVFALINKSLKKNKQPQQFLGKDSKQLHQDNDDTESDSNDDGIPLAKIRTKGLTAEKKYGKGKRKKDFDHHSFGTNSRKQKRVGRDSRKGLDGVIVISDEDKNDNNTGTEAKTGDSGKSFLYSSKLFDVKATKKQFDDINSFLDHSLLDTLDMENQIAANEKVESAKKQKEIELLQKKREKAMVKVFKVFNADGNESRLAKKKGNISNPVLNRGFCRISHANNMLFARLKPLSYSQVLLILQASISTNSFAEVRDNASIIARLQVDLHGQDVIQSIDELVDILEKIGTNKSFLHDLSSVNANIKIENYMQPQISEDIIKSSLPAGAFDTELDFLKKPTHQDKQLQRQSYQHVKLIRHKKTTQLFLYKLQLLCDVLTKQKYHPQLLNLTLKVVLASYLDEQVAGLDNGKTLAYVVQTLLHWMFDDSAHEFQQSLKQLSSQKQFFRKIPSILKSSKTSSFFHSEFSNFVNIFKSLTNDNKLLFKLAYNFFTSTQDPQFSALLTQARLYLALLFFCEISLKLDFAPLIKKPFNAESQKLPNGNSNVSIPTTTVAEKSVLNQTDEKYSFINKRLIEYITHQLKQELCHLSEQKLQLKDFRFDDDEHDSDEIKHILANNGIHNSRYFDPRSDSILENSDDANGTPQIKSGISAYMLLLKFTSLHVLLINLVPDKDFAVDYKQFYSTFDVLKTKKKTAVLSTQTSIPKSVSRTATNETISSTTGQLMRKVTRFADSHEISNDNSNIGSGEKDNGNDQQNKENIIYRGLNRAGSFPINQKIARSTATDVPAVGATAAASPLPKTYSPSSADTIGAPPTSKSKSSTDFYHGNANGSANGNHKLKSTLDRKTSTATPPSTKEAENLVDDIALSINIIFQQYIPASIPSDLTSSLAFWEVKRLLLLIKNTVNDVKKYLEYDTLVSNELEF